MLTLRKFIYKFILWAMTRLHSYKTVQFKTRQRTHSMQTPAPLFPPNGFSRASRRRLVLSPQLEEREKIWLVHRHGSSGRMKSILLSLTLREREREREGALRRAEALAKARRKTVMMIFYLQQRKKQQQNPPASCYRVLCDFLSHCLL